MNTHSRVSCALVSASKRTVRYKGAQHWTHSCPVLLGMNIAPSGQMHQRLGVRHRRGSMAGWYAGTGSNSGSKPTVSLARLPGFQSQPLRSFLREACWRGSQSQRLQMLVSKHELCIDPSRGMADLNLGEEQRVFLAAWLGVSAGKNCTIITAIGE